MLECSFSKTLQAEDHLGQNRNSVCKDFTTAKYVQRFLTSFNTISSLLKTHPHLLTKKNYREIM